MVNAYEKRLLWILGFIIVIGTLLYGGDFLSTTTLVILANQLPEYGLISLALMLTLIISGMNLSIVAMTTLSGVIGAIVMERLSGFSFCSVLIGVGVMLIFGVMTGAINGVIISYLEVSPILATLGTMLFFSGVALNITKGGAITSFDPFYVMIGSGNILGIPIPFVVFIVVGLILYLLLTHHEIGRQLYLIGMDRQSAIYSGIDVKKTVLKAYMIAGLIAGVTAVIMTARYNSIRVDYGSTYLINGIVIITLGGIDLKGGTGSVKGVFIALLIVSLVIRLLNLAYMDSNLIDGIMGLMLLVNIVVQHFSNRNQ